MILLADSIENNFFDKDENIQMEIFMDMDEETTLFASISNSFSGVLFSVQNFLDRNNYMKTLQLLKKKFQ